MSARAAVITRPMAPRAVIAGAGVLVALCLALVVAARLLHYRPAQPPAASVVQSSDLRFEDRADGAIAVLDASSTRLIYSVLPGTQGFVRGVLRGLARTRKAEHIGAAAPFRLTHWSDGRLSLDDPSTARHIDLEVFGPANAGAFAAILLASKEPP